MWTNDMNVELISKAPIQFMNKARFVVTMPSGISRGYYKNFPTMRNWFFEIRHWHVS